MTRFDPFIQQKYLNLETFRKSGEGVKTPVWFVQDGDILFVRTQADSGKVKRIRRSGQVKIAPCKMDGSLLGEWLPVKAREIKDDTTSKKVERLLDQKYGLTKKIFYLIASMRGRQDTILELKVSEES
jgi:uncharacterized protein